MNAVKNGLTRLSPKMCDNLAESLANLNLQELKEHPEQKESLKIRLIEENNKLREEIEQTKLKLKDLQKKLPKNIYNEELPLKVPTVLHTNKSSGDAKSSEDSSPKQEPDQSKEPKNQSKESKKDQKAKGGNKQAVKEPENDKIDSSRLKLLVGKVIEVNRHPDAEKLYVEKIDLGEEQPRTVVSGLVDYVEQDKFLNKMVVVLCNLKSSKLRGILSEAMVMCASDKANGKVELLEPPEGSIAGDRIVFDQYPGEPDSQLNPKKKIWEQVAVDLKTNDNKVACYKGDPFRVKDKGVVTSPSLANTQIS